MKRTLGDCKGGNQREVGERLLEDRRNICSGRYWVQQWVREPLPSRTEAKLHQYHAVETCHPHKEESAQFQNSIAEDPERSRRVETNSSPQVNSSRSRASTASRGRGRRSCALSLSNGPKGIMWKVIRNQNNDAEDPAASSEESRRARDVKDHRSILHSFRPADSVFPFSRAASTTCVRAHYGSSAHRDRHRR